MMENQKQNLHRAISELPTWSAPAKGWQQIEQVLEQAKEPTPLQRAIKTYKTDQLSAPVSWEQLEKKLVNEEILQDAVADLPQYKIAADLFEPIIRRLAGGNPQVHSALVWRASLAASILILLGVIWINQLYDNNEKVEIAYSQETIQPPSLLPSTAHLSEDKDMVQFINQNCRALQVACENPKFKGLLHQYQELEAAQQELENQLVHHQEQTQLITYLVRIEKEKTEVGKQLIQYLMI